MKNYEVIENRIYTDGSCKKITSYDGTGFIAWGFIVVRDEKIIKGSLGTYSEPNGTSQRAELHALIDALNYIKENKTWNQRYHIYSDSAYAVNGLNGWIKGWLSNGWKNSKGEEVANKDLWLQLVDYQDLQEVFIHKVKGHDKDYWNNIIDEMVQNEAQKIKLEWRGING